MNTLPVDKHAETLIAKWKEAKENEAGWNAVRKEAEAELATHYKADFDQLVAAIDKTTNLTTTAGIGHDLKVTVGNEMKVDQVSVIEFLTNNPMYLGILFKAEYKPVTAAVLGRLYSEEQIAEPLAKACKLKPKNPSFSAQ
jgi:hypothetical protein